MVKVNKGTVTEVVFVVKNNIIVVVQIMPASSMYELNVARWSVRLERCVNDRFL